MRARPKDQLENRPGALANIGDALGQAGVNIDGLCSFASDVNVREDARAHKHTLHKGQIERCARARVCD